MNLVYAQQGRQILDLIVGFKISPILWKHIVSNTKNSLSAGRCQTPALRLVYENYKEIQESPGKLSFNTTGIFSGKNIIFALNHNHLSHDEIKKFLELSKTHKHILSKRQNEKLKRINLVHLQQVDYNKQQIIICIFHQKILWLWLKNYMKVVILHI